MNFRDFPNYDWWRNSEQVNGKQSCPSLSPMFCEAAAVESGFCLIDIGTEGSALSPERVGRVSETAGAE